MRSRFLRRLADDSRSHGKLVQVVRPPFDIPRYLSWCVYNSNVTMVYGTSNELVTGANLNQRSHHWGASHCMELAWEPGPNAETW